MINPTWRHRPNLLQPHRQVSQIRGTGGWLVALILFALGFGAPVVLGDVKTETGEDDTGLVNGVAYLTWILSWLAAAGGAVVGVVG